MKRIIFLCLFLIIGITCFAQHEQEIGALISSDLNENFEAIQKEAADLDYSQRLLLYDQYKIDVPRYTGPVVNILLQSFLLGNFGIGNFMQKDPWAPIILTGDLAGKMMFITGLLFMITPSFSNGYNSGFMSGYVPLILSVGGIILSEIFGIVGIVRTFIYPSIYNSKLENALQVGPLTLNIEPKIDITANGLEMALVRMKY